MTAFHIAIAAISLSVTLVITAIGFAYKRGKWEGAVNSDRAGFRDFMGEVRADIKKILERLPANTTATSSPIRLTELGERISEKIAAKAWAELEAPKFSNKTKDKDALGIQEIAFQHAKDFDPEAELLEKMRVSAFEGGVGLDGVRDVLGVELRDVLLKQCGIHSSSLD